MEQATLLVSKLAFVVVEEGVPTVAIAAQLRLLLQLEVVVVQLLATHDRKYTLTLMLAFTNLNSTYTPTSCPLDPAVDPTDQKSKYRGASRDGASAGRVGGNVNQTPGRPQIGLRVNPVAASAPVRPPRPFNGNVIDMLADPNTFMQAVNMMKASKPTLLAPKPATLKTTATAPVFKARSKPSNTIESKWGDPPPSKPSKAEKAPKAIALPSRAAVRPKKPLATLPLAPAAVTLQIRQVPTNEFALPHPHRGDTESWTDGVESDHLSAMDNSPTESEQFSRPSSPVASGIGGVGLGIQGLPPSSRVDIVTESRETANDVDLMDVTEDLSVLNESPLTPAPLAERILVSGHWYILDHSALGNAVAEPVVPAPAAAVKSLPQKPSPTQGEWTSPIPDVVSEAEPKKASTTKVPSAKTSTTKAPSIPTGPSSIIRSHVIATGTGTQTTPSLIQSSWANAPQTNTFRHHANNPFANETAPPRAPVTQVLRRSEGEFTSFVRVNLEAIVSSQFGFRDASTNAELISLAGIGSATSTPSVGAGDNLGLSMWGRENSPVITSIFAGGRQISEIPVSSVARASTQRRPRAPAPTSVNYEVATIDADNYAPRRIDALELVSLQQAGGDNSSVEMTPFQITAPASTSAAPTSTRSAHTGQHSAAASETSRSTAHSRGLTSSRYTSPDAVAPTLGSLSLNAVAPLRGGDTLPKPPTTCVAFGTGTNVSRFAQDENCRPTSAADTFTSADPVFAKPNAISNNRRQPGAGYAVLMADLAVAGNQASVTSQSAWLFSSSAMQTAGQVIGEEDSYDDL